eukprot:scaffold158_cov105-Cylindrotheca_fusiformis.AAC.20
MPSRVFQLFKGSQTIRNELDFSFSESKSLQETELTPIQNAANSWSFRFFDLCPDAISLFSFGNELRPTDDGLEEDDSLEKNPRLMRHIGLFMRFFADTIDMLGPDVESLEESVIDFARRHKEYGVTKEHYQMMKIAILASVQTMLGDDLKPEWEKSWDKLTNFIMRVMKMDLMNPAIEIEFNFELLSQE